MASQNTKDHILSAAFGAATWFTVAPAAFLGGLGGYLTSASLEGPEALSMTLGILGFLGGGIGTGELGSYLAEKQTKNFKPLTYCAGATAGFTMFLALAYQLENSNKKEMGTINYEEPAIVEMSRTNDVL